MHVIKRCLVARAVGYGIAVGIVALPFSAPLAFALALSVGALTLSRWVRRARLREVVEVAALTGPGLAVLTLLYNAGPARVWLSVAGIAASSAAFLIGVASVPNWETGKGAVNLSRSGERARWADLPALRAIIRASFPKPPISAPGLAWAILRGRCRVIRESEEVAGLVVLIPLSGAAVWVDVLAVHPAHRRKGIATRLIAGLDEAFLTVREANAGALAFYERAEFSVIARWPDYYGAGEGALVMRSDRL